MFEWLIPLTLFVAVFLLTREGQRHFAQGRLRRQALLVAQVKDHSASSGLKPQPAVEEIFFRLLPILAAWQKRWVPSSWGLKTGKKLAHLPKWQGRGAAEWWVVKELAALIGLSIGWVLGDFFLALAAVLVAFFLPDLWLSEQDAKRRKRIMRELPDLLELLASCISAGMGFEQALTVILDRGQKGPLYAELAEMMRLIRMGQSRRDALQSMARRVDEQDFTTFVTALVQAERLGVSIRETLKIQAIQLRQKRSQQVEKQALEAPVKLLFPLIVFIFPVVFLILFGPIIIRFLQGF
jgi:tight adherence protein C